MKSTKYDRNENQKFKKGRVKEGSELENLLKKKVLWSFTVISLGKKIKNNIVGGRMTSIAKLYKCRI